MAVIEILLSIIRWIILICMMSGFVYMVRVKMKIQMEFIPIFICATSAVIVFLGGIIKLLLPTACILVLLGLICFGKLVKNRKEYAFEMSKLSLARVGLTVGSIGFLLQILHTNLTHYDNYSHWALVVKEMLITQSFPTTDSVLITFQNYPLGMSSFVYFICMILGNAESYMIFAQGLLIFSCIFAIFGIITETKRSLLATFLATGFSILSIFNLSIRINNLIVDFVLPILTLAIIAVIYRYRYDFKQMAVLLCPMMALLVIVKSTGIIYAGIAIVYYIYVVWKYRENYGKSGKYLALDVGKVLFLSTVTTFIWNVYVKIVFAGVDNKFEMDTAALQDTYAGKSAEDIRNIITLFIQSILDVTSRQTMGIILFEVLAIIMCIIGVKLLHKKWMLPRMLIALNIILVLYCLGILGMYIFSMPLEEALYLAGFERYISSIVIFFGGALTMCATIDLESSFYYRIGEVPDYQSFKSIKMKKIYNNGVLVCIFLIVLILSSEYNGMQYYVKNYEDTLSAKVKAVVGDQWQEEVDTISYLVYASDQEEQVSNGFVEYVAKYYLRADQVDTICYFYEDNLLNLLSQYDKLVIVETDSEEKALLQEYLGIDGEAGIYDLEELL